MSKIKSNRGKVLKIAGVKIPRGKTVDIPLSISETYTGIPVTLLIRVIRSKKPGPRVFLTGGVHGDELNGVGVVRQVMIKNLRLLRGALVCLPLVNVYGFERHSRYLPDRRDLNRSFPGSPTGSLASRLAYKIFKEVLSQCHYGIDLHSATIRRTNFPQIRADLKIPRLKKLAHAFGCELIVNKKGHTNSLRYQATHNGCPTLLYEAGEVFKFESSSIDLGVRGVQNVLKTLKMIPGKIERPAYQTPVNKTFWVRADKGGIINFHIKPGDLVYPGKKLATIEHFFSKKVHTVLAPQKGIILGMSTLPAVKPGEPICHIAVPQIPLSQIKKALTHSPNTLHRKAQAHLSTNFAGRS